MNDWHIIGYHISLGSGIIRDHLDQFTAYRLHRELIRDYPTAQLRIIQESNMDTVKRRAADLILGLGVESISSGGWVDSSFTDSSFALVDTIEYKPRGYATLQPLTVMPDDPRYDSYLQMLDDIIRDDWDIVEEIAHGLVTGHTPVVIEKYDNLLSDLYFRKNYLSLRDRNL